MIEMSLSAAARAMQAKLQGSDMVFRGCSTDSRTITAGQVFIALKGEHFDGHQFVDMAKRKGAVAALISGKIDIDMPTLRVADVRHAMGKLASTWRESFSIPLVAITGSNGKTTVKEMLGAILRIKAPVLTTRGNLNNEIGVPLTLYGLGKEHAYAVIEMGANHPGEIGRLSHIAQPTVAVITQCAPAHLEGFGTIDGVAAAKAEIFEGLDKDGIAIINADDDYAGLWRKKTAAYRQISFGMREDAEISAIPMSVSASIPNRFTLSTPLGATEISLSLPGRHNIMNAMAAAACAVALDIELAVIRQGLEGMQTVKGRLQVLPGRRHSILIDDTYNANPASLQAALDVLSGFPGRHWLVLGDMGELGTETVALHAAVGEQARKNGVEKLFALGPLSRNSVGHFGEGGRHFESMDAMINQLCHEITGDVCILVKGSRAMQMERVIQQLEVAG